MAFRIVENGEFRGEVTLLNAILNANCVGNAQVKGSDPVDAGKLQHQHRAVYGQASAATAVAETRVVHVVRGMAGQLQAFHAGCVTPCQGDATVTVDLFKGGVSVLLAAIVLDSGDAAYALTAATIDTDTVQAGDVLEVAVTVNAGTGTLGEGPFAYVDLFEDAD